MSKGLMQSSDPATADFLIDYHFAVDRRSETVQTVYPGAYPGLVCGPYGCYRGGGYGPAAVGYERVHWRAGTIAFNFMQNPSRHLVYQAIGEKPVKRDTFTLTQDEINGLVNHLLKERKTKQRVAVEGIRVRMVGERRAKCRSLFFRDIFGATRLPAPMFRAVNQ